MGPVQRFLKKYQKNVFHLLLEEYLGFLTRSLPGIEGMIVRRGIYRLLCKKLGKSSLIYAGAYLTHAYGIEIGDKFSINSGALIDGRGRIKIGNGVMVGPNSVIVSSRHQFEKTDIPMTSLDHIMQPVAIDDDVWIGALAFVKGGVRIGKGAVISAGTAVLADVPEYAIVTGVPAIITGYRKDKLGKDN